MAFGEKYVASVRGKRSTLWKGTRGPIALELHAAGAASILFSNATQAERNTIVRGALIAGGDFWVRAFLPKRFTDYAKRLGYKVTAKWEEFKRKLVSPVLPFVGVGGDYARKGNGREGTWPPGFMRLQVLNRSRADASSTASKQQIRIRIPFGHPVQRRTALLISRVPAWELERIAQVCGKTMRDILAGEFGGHPDGPLDLAKPVPITRRPPGHRGPAHTPRRAA